MISLVSIEIKKYFIFFFIEKLKLNIINKKKY
jgi:hypothetical protein